MEGTGQPEQGPQASADAACLAFPLGLDPLQGMEILQLSPILREMDRFLIQMRELGQERLGNVSQEQGLS